MLRFVVLYMAPYFCYIHHGLYVSVDYAEGCHHEQCIEFALKTVPPAGVSISGHGMGSAAQEYSRDQSDIFHKDMYAFKAAADQGVEPDQVTAVAAEAALKQAEATEHGTD